jgi:hypothetical protein
MANARFLKKTRAAHGAAWRRRREGSTLVLALTTITLLAIMAAYTLRRVAPKFRMAAQAAGWQEARLAAEAGVDVGLWDLQQNAAGPAPETWSGWTQIQGGAVGNPPGGTAIQGNTLPDSLLGAVLSPVLGLVNSLLSLLGGPVALSSPTPVMASGATPVTMSSPIALNNLQVSPGVGMPTTVDLKLWAVYPTLSPYYRWFRIRAMSTCPLPQPCYQTTEDLDVSLRRYSLRSVRPQLKTDDNNGPATAVPTPSASRIVEVLVEPVLPFELAIMANQSLSLATSGGWRVDSFDSNNPQKSNPDGTYPGSASPLTQSNGNIASDLGRPATSLYGPLIAVNGCTVCGGVSTNGGDDPTTPAHENVSGASGVNPSRIRSDFYREMPPFARPASGIFLTAPRHGAPFVAGTTEPTLYLINKNLSAFAVAPPANGVKGAVVIMVNGDLDVPTGTITIPPNVTAVIYVRGNIDFHGQSINMSAESSQRAAQLQIYGENANGETRTLQAYGNAAICAAFYGLDYDVTLQDNVEWIGAVAGHSFQMIGGGSGGLHYDEALGLVGQPISFRIARYVEDVRE